ncbi:hypothetical protein ACWC1D_10080 [Streptomyces sp. NPDC001478]
MPCLGGGDMGETLADRLGSLRALIIFDWRDGPIEGIAGSVNGSTCWYFKLFAERHENDTLDDRIFALWPISDSDSSILCEEFGQGDEGGCVWPVSGGLGSSKAQSIVEGLLSARPESPNLIIRTPDFVEVFGIWNVTPG